MAIIKPVRGFTPKYGQNCFFAENSVVVGDVELGDNCTVWFNAVIRGDVNSIRIGSNTNIQDGAVIHCTYLKADTQIGNNVSIGHNAIVHGCRIEDDVLIGMGAIVMDKAIVHKGAVIAAGAVVLQGQDVEGGFIYAGVPAKKVKPAGKEMEDLISRTAKNYPMYAEWFREGSNS